MLHKSWLQNSKISVVKEKGINISTVMNERHICFRVKKHNCSRTRMCAIEDCFCMAIKPITEDRAIVHVTRFYQTLSCIFEQQITFSILLRLKELEGYVWI